MLEFFILFDSFVFVIMFLSSVNIIVTVFMPLLVIVRFVSFGKTELTAFLFQFVSRQPPFHLVSIVLGAASHSHVALILFAVV